jgi:hypothetical protein
MNPAAGAELPEGNIEHRVASSETAPVEAATDGMAQPCFPLRRQQAGRLDSADASIAGAISGKLNTASSMHTKARRIVR